MLEPLLEPQRLGERAPFRAGPSLVLLLRAGRWPLFGSVLLFAVLAMAAQRADFVGLSMPRWSDWLPAALSAAAGLLLAGAASRSGRGRAAVGFAVAWVCGGLAGALLLGASLGSWWILAPEAFAAGASLGLLGLVEVRLGAVAALAAVAGGALAPWGFTTLVAAVGPGACSAAAAAGLLVLALASGSPSPATNRSAVRSGASWWVQGAIALLALWLLAPSGLWSGLDGPRLAIWGGLAAGALAAWLGGSRWLTGVFAALAGLCLLGPAPVRENGDDRVRVLASSGAAVATYARSTQELQLWSDGTLVDAAGPDRPQAELIATLLATLLAPGDRVLLLGLGTGRLPQALDAAGIRMVDAVDFRADARPLLSRLQTDGPVPIAIEPPAPSYRVVRRGIGPALAALPRGSRQAIVVAEPLHARSGDQLTVERQLELRRVAGEGLVVQPFAMDRTGPAALAALFAAAASAHPWNGVFAVGECALLVSSTRAPAWPASTSFAAWSDAARWQAHAAHIGSVADLQRAWLGTVAAIAVANGDGDGDGDGAGPTEKPQDRAAVLKVLHDLLVPAPDGPGRDPASLLLWWTQVNGDMRRDARTLRAMPGDAESSARAQSLAIRYLPIGAPLAELQAALAMPDGDDVRLSNPAAASLRAQAIDPTFFFALPPLFAALPLPRTTGSELEDLAMLPADPRLCELCSGEQPLAVGLRARFPSRCARALVAALAQAPLAPAMAKALRELADPFVLAEAGIVLGCRRANRELLGLWRGDLAMPRALADLQRGSAEERRALVEALAGRKDEVSLRTLGEFLVDPDRSLRGAAGVALFATVGHRVDYDPDWPRSALLAAAERLRALHNRAP